MPPMKPIPLDITSLTDEGLTEQLLQYDVRPGPILPTTRVVYERQLFKLRTGQVPASPTNYEPVDDDDDHDAQQDSVDDEVVLQHHQPRQRTTRSSKPEPQRTPPRQPAAQQTPKGTAARRAQAPHDAKGTKEASKPLVPLWLKLVLILLVAGLVFLVVKNMESDPASEGPDIPDQIEINV